MSLNDSNIENSVKELEKFSKQISLNVGVNYSKNRKVPIFYELLLHKSISKSQKFNKFVLGNFVNFDPVWLNNRRLEGKILECQMLKYFFICLFFHHKHIHISQSL